VLAIAVLAAIGAGSLERGGTPWVIRAIFEDRTRMVV